MSKSNLTVVACRVSNPPRYANTRLSPSWWWISWEAPQTLGHVRPYCIQRAACLLRHGLLPRRYRHVGHVATLV